MQPAGPDDAPLLAEMNAQLIQDEGSRNPMTVVKLEQRMRGWLTSGWSAVLMRRSEQLVGYALYQVREDEYTQAPEVYLRQFFVKREHRGQGLGRAAFQQFVRVLVPPGAVVVLQVLEANPRARRFWESVGCRPYCTTLRYLTGDSA